uniref:Uncharacterized protein n=1 Tax=Helicotheca tamesis TaxID=374047 RepID=A0A7S2HES9_9STRA|mmetsp:Transcript_17490/g.24125  ORF Transcript_17490/g.24125 Transcript_17490/m.24125 type:complete len:159 (+) Transcript_17490:113-589(+)
MRASCYLVGIVCAFASVHNASTFTISPALKTLRNHHAGPITTPLQSRQHIPSKLFAEKNNNNRVDKEYRDEILAASEERGKTLFLASLLLVTWSFSIPVELRRTHFCFVDECVQNRAVCYDCLTFSEWFGKVIQFYQTTDISDWVHFDFSVDPTSMLN